MLRLRQIDAQEYQLARVYRLWKERGVEMELAYPDRRGLWLLGSDPQKAWRGWLYLPELLELMLPGLAGQALTPATGTLLMNWISALPDFLSADFSALHFTGFYPETLSETGPGTDRRLLRVCSPRLTLWVESVSVLPSSPAEGVSSVEALRWPVRYAIGSSTIRVQTCQQIAPGDLLLIRYLRTVVRCLNTVLFPFRLEEGNMPDKSLFEEFEEELLHMGDDSPDADTDTLRGADSKAMMARRTRDQHQFVLDTGQLPMVLEFVIHRQVMNLRELQALHEERVYVLPEGGEKQVEVLANGGLIGRGELVQVGDKLGVEITSWMGEQLHSE